MERLLPILVLCTGCHLVTGAADFETHDFVGEWSGLAKLFVATETYDLNADMNVQSDDGVFEIRAASASFQVDVDYALQWDETSESQYTVELECTPPGSCVALHDVVCMELFNRVCGPDDPRLPPAQAAGRCVTSDDADDLECDLIGGGVQFLCAFKREK